MVNLLIIGLILSCLIPFITILLIITLLIYEKYNIVSGILIFTLIAFTGFIIFPEFFIFWYGDIYYTIGGLIGLTITFKNRKPDQLFIKTGIIVGISGASLSSFLISIFQWLIYTIIRSFDILVLGTYLLLFTPFALILGIIIGYIYGYYKRRQEENEEDLSYL